MPGRSRERLKNAGISCSQAAQLVKNVNGRTVTLELTVLVREVEDGLLQGRDLDAQRLVLLPELIKRRPLRGRHGALR